MSIMRMQSFGTRTARDCGLVAVAGTPQFETVDLPAGSGSLTALKLQSNDLYLEAWIDGEQTGTRKEPSGTNWEMGFRLKRGGNSATTNVNTRYGTGRSGSPNITISFENNTNKLTIEVAAVVKATAVSFAASLAQHERLSLVADQQDGGVVNVYADGDRSSPVLTYTLTAGDIAALPGKPNEFWYQVQGAVTDLVDDVWAIDPDDGVGVTNPALLMESYVAEIPFTTDGATYAQWNGAVGDMNDVPVNAGTDIDTPVVDQVSTFGHGGTSETKVFAVATRWRSSRTGSDAGVNVQIRQREQTPGTDLDETITAAPGDGNIYQPHHTPASGGDWTPAKFGDTTFGPVART